MNGIIKVNLKDYLFNMKNYIIENRVTGMLLLAIICLFCVSIAMNAQQYKIDGKTVTILKPDKSSSEPINTGFT